MVLGVAVVFNSEWLQAMWLKQVVMFFFGGRFSMPYISSSWMYGTCMHGNACSVAACTEKVTSDDYFIHLMFY